MDNPFPRAIEHSVHYILAALLGCWVGWVAGQLDLQGVQLLCSLLAVQVGSPLNPALRVAFAPAKSGGRHRPQGKERSDLPLGAGLLHRWGT